MSGIITVVSDACRPFAQWDSLGKTDRRSGILFHIVTRVKDICYPPSVRISGHAEKNSEGKKRNETRRASVELISHGCQEPHQRALASVIEKTINGSQGRGRVYIRLSFFFSRYLFLISVFIRWRCRPFFI